MLEKELWLNAQHRELDWWRTAQLDRVKLESWARGIENGLRQHGHAGLPDVLLEVGPGGAGVVNFVRFQSKVAIEPLLGNMRSDGIGIHSRDVHWIQGVGERLPFKDDSFGYAVLFNLVDHVLRPEAILAETRRVLVGDGVMYFMVDTYSPYHRILRKYRRDPMHPHTFTREKIDRLLVRSGFHTIHVQDDDRGRGRGRNLKVRRYCVARK